MTEVDTAERLLRLHRMARGRFDQPVFVDPAMVMLLELLIAGRDGRGLSETGLADAAGLPRMTGQRYLDVLARQGLIRKRPDDGTADDALSLTAEGDARIGQLLRDWC